MRDWGETRGGQASRWAGYLMAAPDFFHLLCKLSADAEVPWAIRARVLGAIAYFISPMDFLPEMMLGPVGFLDDVAFAAYVINSLVGRAGPHVVRRHWAGDADILRLIEDVLAAADEMVGKGLWARLRKM